MGLLALQSLTMNPDRFVTSNRKLAVIAQRMVSVIAGDLVAATAGERVADVPWGYKLVKFGTPGVPYVQSPAPFEWDEAGAWWDESEPASILAGMKPGDVEIPFKLAEPEMHTNRIVPGGKAIEFLTTVAENIGKKLKNQLFQKGTYVAWHLSKKSDKIVGRALALAVSDVAASLYVRRKPHGVEKISTRNWKKWSFIRQGKFNGRPAYHRPVGRPALTAAQWRLRYWARKVARRKHADRTRKDKRKPPQPPPTQTPRPQSAWRVGQGRGFRQFQPAKESTPFLPMHGSITAYKAFGEHMAKHLGKEIGVELGKTAVDHCKKWLEDLQGVVKDKGVLASPIFAWHSPLNAPRPVPPAGRWARGKFLLTLFPADTARKNCTLAPD